ncbi:hypothetical protein SCA6_001833 [Theobroma cacao]
MSRFLNERIDESKLVKEKTTNDFLDVLLKYEGKGKEGPDTVSHHIVIIIKQQAAQLNGLWQSYSATLNQRLRPNKSLIELLDRKGRLRRVI